VPAWPVALNICCFLFWKIVLLYDPIKPIAEHEIQAQDSTMALLKSKRKTVSQAIETLNKRIVQLEDELKRVTYNFSAALEQGKAVVYSRNFESDTYEFMGDGIKDLTGYSAKEITPALFDSISITAEPQGELASVSLDEAYRRNRTGIVNRWIADTAIRTKSGEVRYILDMSTLLRDSEGHTYGTLGILLDITERKHMEQTLVGTTEELRQKNEEMELDLETAREIQRTLLAHHYKYFPTNVPAESSSVRFCNAYIPARQLSGDFFYILPVSETVVGVLIGDVMGHGVRASLVTAYVRGLIEEIRPFGNENGKVLRRLNDGLISVLSRSRATSFVTASYLTVDIQNKVLQYANAGHPEPLFVNTTTGAIPAPFNKKRETEPALGLIKDFPYTVLTRPVSSGDVVYLYTDGVHDVRNEDESFFGKDRFISFVNSRFADPPESLLDALLKEIRQFAGAKKDFNDDICLVALQFIAP
jgi:PAS domain S-box-containing protein